MQWFRAYSARPWWLASASVIGLLVVIAFAGLVGLAINARVKALTDRALQYDVELEDRGAELLLAVLEVRHLHRNIVFSSVLSSHSVADYEAAYTELLSQIDRLDRLGMPDARLPQPSQLRVMVQDYYAGFRSVIELHGTDQAAFFRASDDGLIKLAEIASMAATISRMSEERSQAALMSLERATEFARRVQFAVLAGLALVAAGLGYTTVRMVREQQDTAEKLAHALQAKTDFIADASHELRTPLTVLRGNAEVALEQERNCVHVELLEEIVKETEHMSSLVEDLLFLARSDAGSIPLATETVDVEPLLVEVAERAAMLARERGATFEARLEADGQIAVDASRIAQVVLILVDNAAKYSPRGAPITMKATSRGNDLLIEVQDRGPGVPKAHLPMIFERFYRVDKGRARKQGGTGLGLAIAKTIVEAHGGRISAESSVNTGTTMCVYLPCVEAATSDSRLATSGGVGDRA